MNKLRIFILLTAFAIVHFKDGDIWIAGLVIFKTKYISILESYSRKEGLKYFVLFSFYFVRVIWKCQYIRQLQHFIVIRLLMQGFIHTGGIQEKKSFKTAGFKSEPADAQQSLP